VGLINFSNALTSSFVDACAEIEKARERERDRKIEKEKEGGASWPRRPIRPHGALRPRGPLVSLRKPESQLVKLITDDQSIRRHS